MEIGFFWKFFAFLGVNAVAKYIDKAIGMNGSFLDEEFPEGFPTYKKVIHVINGITFFVLCVFIIIR